MREGLEERMEKGKEDWGKLRGILVAQVLVSLVSKEKV